jgi:hypothetical protein
MVAGDAAGQRDHGADDARGRTARQWIRLCGAPAHLRSLAAGLRAFGLATDMLRDGRKPKTLQVRLLDGDVEIGRCTALLTAQGCESPADPFSKATGADAAPETGSPPPAFAQKWSRYFQNVSVRLIEGALEKPGPAAAGMRLDGRWSKARPTRRCRPCRGADFSSGVGQIVDMREWTFINPEIRISTAHACMPRVAGALPVPELTRSADVKLNWQAYHSDSVAGFSQATNRFGCITKAYTHLLTKEHCHGAVNKAADF